MAITRGVAIWDARRCRNPQHFACRKTCSTSIVLVNNCIMNVALWQSWRKVFSVRTPPIISFIFNPGCSNMQIVSSHYWTRAHTELMACIASGLVEGSHFEPATTQLPQPPSAHNRLVPTKKEKQKQMDLWIENKIPHILFIWNKTHFMHQSIIDVFIHVQFELR